jgi:hypothetical protein
MTRKKNGKLDLSGYSTNQELTNVRRAADFLDWFAQRYPEQFVQYNVLYRAIMGFARTPRIDSIDVDRLRKSLSRTKKLLNANYGRGMIRVRSLGVRATCGDDDRVNHELPKAFSDLAGKKEAIERIIKDINPRLIVDPKMRSWFTRDARGIIKMMNDENVDIRALPPAAREEKKKK